MRSSRRWWMLAGIALATALLFWPRSRTDAARAVLEAAAATLGARAGEDASQRRERLRRELAPRLAEDVRVDVAGAFAGQGRERVLSAATDLARGRHEVIELRQIELTSNDANHVSARFDVVASDSQAGDLHASPRHARAELQKRPDGWQITALGVDRAAPSEPEPRP